MNLCFTCIYWCIHCIVNIVLDWYQTLKYYVSCFSLDQKLRYMCYSSSCWLPCNNLHFNVTYYLPYSACSSVLCEMFHNQPSHISAFSAIGLTFLIPHHFSNISHKLQYMLCLQVLMKCVLTIIVSVTPKINCFFYEKFYSSLLLITLTTETSLLLHV